MADLRKFLARQDDSFLKIIAHFWNLDVRSPYKEDAVDALLSRMLDENCMKDILSQCSPKAIRGLSYLVDNDGIIEMGSFTQKFGEIRIMGLKRIEREMPWKNPVSAAEELWYRGLLFQNMLEFEDGLNEGLCLPADLFVEIRGLLPASGDYQNTVHPPFITRPASPGETLLCELASDSILDLACLLLAAKRSGKSIHLLEETYGRSRLEFCLEIFGFCNVLPETETFDAEKLRTFLVGSRHAALLTMLLAWRQSQEYDELEADSELHVPEKLQRSCVDSRNSILFMLKRIPQDGWLGLSGFIASVEQEDASFLRQTITDIAWQVFDKDGNSLAGSGSWDQFEGEFIRFLIFGPLHWLGIVDIAYSDKEKTCRSAFRISEIGKVLLREAFLSELPESITRAVSREKAVPGFTVDGRIIARADTSRMFRYQAARYCEIEKVRIDECVFRITPESLETACENGLTIPAFITLMKRIGGKTVPQNLVTAIQKWEKEHSRATIYDALIFSAADPGVIDELISNKNTSQWILQRLNATTITIKRGGVNVIRRVLMEMELLVNIKEQI